MKSLLGKNKSTERKPLLEKKDSDKSMATINEEDCESVKKSKIPQTLLKIKGRIVDSVIGVTSRSSGG
ncbi:MAG: hypothetical protein ACJA02_000553 [Myxococcota bacterium]|jgi:hypothetical protein